MKCVLVGGEGGVDIPSSDTPLVINARELYGKDKKGVGPSKSNTLHEQLKWIPLVRHTPMKGTSPLIGQVYRCYTLIQRSRDLVSP